MIMLHKLKSHIDAHDEAMPIVALTTYSDTPLIIEIGSQVDHCLDGSWSGYNLAFAHRSLNSTSFPGTCWSVHSEYVAEEREQR